MTDGYRPGYFFGENNGFFLVLILIIIIAALYTCGSGSYYR